MIAKAKACKGGGALMNYVVNDEKGYELDRNLLSGTNSKELYEDLQVYTEQNQRAQNKLFSIVLSPAIEDGKKLTNNELKNILRDFMNSIGINPKEQPYIAFVHTEKDHKHIHVIASRVKDNGQLISDHHIGKKAQLSAHNIALENNLTSARSIMIEKIKSNEKIVQNNKGNFIPLKNRMYQKHLQVMKSNPLSYEDYKSRMFKLGILVQETINKQGQIQGHRLIDCITNKSFKASEIHRNMGLKNLIEKGLPFKNDVSLTPSLSVAQNIGFKIVKKIIQSIINQSISY